MKFITKIRKLCFLLLFDYHFSGERSVIKPEKCDALRGRRVEDGNGAAVQLIQRNDLISKLFYSNHCEILKLRFFMEKELADFLIPRSEKNKRCLFIFNTENV